MKTKVSEHKGFEIYFDDSTGKFTVEGYDQQIDKGSFSSCKTYINNFIKENNVFGEFKLTKLPNKHQWGRNESKTFTVKGIHANGNFLCEYPDGEKFQLSTYQYDSWCVPEQLEKSEYDAEKVAKWKKETDVLYNKIKEEEKKLPPDCTELLKKVKEEYSYLWKK